MHGAVAFLVRMWIKIPKKGYKSNIFCKNVQKMDNILNQRSA